jgi:hypothetical protein
VSKSRTTKKTPDQVPLEPGNPFQGKGKRGSRITVSAKDRRTADGIVFDSMWEMRVYLFLKENFGKRAFRLQPVFELQPGFVNKQGRKIRPISYHADFIFGRKRANVDSPVGPKHVVIDAKGMKDAVFRMKHKMFMYQYDTILHMPSRVKDLEPLADHISKVTGKPRKSHKTAPKSKKAKKSQ